MKKSQKINHRMTLRSYAIVFVTLGSFVGIVYLIHNHSINFTLHFYIWMILYYMVGISLITWIGKAIRKVFSLPKYTFLEIFLSISIYWIAFPIIAVLALIVMVAMLKESRWRYHIMNILANTAVFLLGARVVFLGSLPKEGPFIVVADHKSSIDYELILLAMGIRPYRPVAGLNLGKIPILGYFIKKYAICVKRDKCGKISPSAAKETEDEIISYLKKGVNIGMFASNGRLDKNDREEGKILKDFKIGAFRASVETGAKIVPTIFWGAQEYAAKDKKVWWAVSPRVIQIIYLDAISPDGKTAKELKEEVFNVMLEKIQELQGLAVTTKNEKVKTVFQKNNRFFI